MSFMKKNQETTHPQKFAQDVDPHDQRRCFVDLDRAYRTPPKPTKHPTKNQQTPQEKTKKKQEKQRKISKKMPKPNKRNKQQQQHQQQHHHQQQQHQQQQQQHQQQQQKISTINVNKTPTPPQKKGGSTQGAAPSGFCYQPHRQCR